MLKRSICAALLAAASAFPAVAAIEVVSAESWDLYRGNSIVQPRVAYPNKAACQAAAPIDVQHRCVGRETFVRRPDAPPPPPPPPTCTAPRPAQETRTQTCPTGTTGSWSQVRSYDAAAYPTCWAAGAWTPAEAPAGEHQATVNLDFSRVVWATNFGSGSRIESVMAGLPSGALTR